MKLKKLEYSLLIVLTLSLFSSSFVFGYDEEVAHPKLTEKAINASNLDSYLKINFATQFISGITTALNGKPIIDLLTQGSTDEDKPRCRASNHFHNPLLPWNDSQMSDDITGLASAIRLYCNDSGWPSIYRKSNITWATGYLSPSPDGLKYMFLSSESPLPINWDTARASYYSALTDKGQASRDADLAATFSALGHVLHLVQDMAVPAHVRNDFQSHLEVADANAPNPIDRYYNPFEWYVKNHTALISNSTITPSFANTRLTDFWDTDKYNGSNPSTLTDTGLAEFTNANYFSTSTIPNNGTASEHTFPYPHIGGANISGPNYQICSYQFFGVAFVNYISRTNKGPCPSMPRSADHFAIASLMNLPGVSDINSISHVWLSPEVHAQYAQDLLPRAVGYSAELLNYFFRGTLDVTWPNTGVYSIADGSKTLYADTNGSRHQQFTKIKTMVMNTTPNNEVIGAGELRAVATYKIIPNYAADLSNYPPDVTAMKAVTYTYSVSLSTPVNDGDIIPGFYTEFTFDFSNAPIPAGITDLTLQVVFKGTIGNEAGNAIAVGMKDVSEPTHLSIWNLSDMYSIKYNSSPYALYTFDQIQSKAAGDSNFMNLLDTDGDNTLDDELYLQPAMTTYTIYFSNGDVWGTSITNVNILPGEHVRLIALADPGVYNYIGIEFDDHIEPEPGFIYDPFTAAVHQMASDGIYDITGAHTFRKGYSAEKQMVVPIIQHFSEGTIGCTPMQPSCPYPDETAIEVNIAPIPFTSVFD